MRRRFPFRTRDGRDGVIRPARGRDARASLAIVADCARDRPRTLIVLEDQVWSPRGWRRHRMDWGPEGATLVAAVDGEIVGQLSVHRAARAQTRHSAEFGITVAARARGIGVGRALMEVLEAWAREHGIDRIGLGVFPTNERAIGLYRSMGYVEEGRQRAAVLFPEGPMDLIQMAKLLAPGGGGPRTGTTIEGRSIGG